MTGLFDHTEYSVKANLLGSKLTVSGSDDEVIFHTAIKDLGHNCELTLFLDKTGSLAVLKIQPVYAQVKKKGLLSRLFHFVQDPSHYDVIDAASKEKTGSIALKEGGRDPVAQAWTINDSEGKEIACLQPHSKGFLGGKFQHAGFVDHDRICWFKSRNSIAGREVKIELSQGSDHSVDTQLLLAVAAKMLVDIVNVGGDGD